MRRTHHRRTKHFNPSRKAFLSLPHLRIFKDLLLYLFAVWGLISLSMHLHTAYRLRIYSKGCDCGSSVAEAISLGCKFDGLAMAWLPEHCRDDELTAEFETQGDGPNGTWVYYADTKHTVVVDRETVAAMGDDLTMRVHMNERWHAVHCVYYWMKLYRTRFTGKIVEPRSDTEGHIKHCGMVMADPGYGTISGVALNTNEE